MDDNTEAQPKPLKNRRFIPRSTWDAARALYIQGVGSGDIAKKLNLNAKTVSGTAQREMWGMARAAYVETKTNQAVKALTKESSDAGKAIQRRLQRDVEATVATLEAKFSADNAIDLDELETREKIAKSVTDRAFKAFGLQDDSKATLTVNVLSMMIDGANTPPSIPQEPSQAVDIQSTASTEP